MEVAIVGGGPAGLWAAEVAAACGRKVTVFDAMPSVGRKFLVAGRGGLNLTHGESLETFATRYSPDLHQPIAWPDLIAGFPPSATRAWASGLGIETFEASSGRIYPVEMKAAPLLRRWVQRLREAGVQFAMHHRWRTLRPDSAGRGVYLEFDGPAGPVEVVARAAVLALGGASWPNTGSTGTWTASFDALGIGVTPFAPANCGWEVNWSASLLATAEGEPLKNLRVSAGTDTAHGELLVTRYGLEGGPVYRLGRVLRGMAEPEIVVDFKPTVSASDLLRKLGTERPRSVRQAAVSWRLSKGAEAILGERIVGAAPPAELAACAKACRIPLRGPRPIAEAISSAGGVRWNELTADLMLKRLPGIFLAGEMIDWEAPTGGYLLQGCFATATRAAAAAAAWRIP